MYLTPRRVAQGVVRRVARVEERREAVGRRWRGGGRC